MCSLASSTRTSRCRRSFRSAIDERISAFLDRQSEQLLGMAGELGPVADLAARLLVGGKRLRPAFCAAGYLAAAGQPEPGDPAGAARRRRESGAPARQCPRPRRRDGRLGPSAGTAGGAPAVRKPAHHVGVVGRSGVVRSGGGHPPGRLVVDVVGGDVPRRGAAADHAGRRRADRRAHAYRSDRPGSIWMSSHRCGRWTTRPGDLDEVLSQVSRVVELKSARYTVQRPAQLGAALGGGRSALHEALAAYGLPLGRAFQFRDDLLGVFGDPAVTGKPAGDDLREGKRTVLIAHAYAQTTPAGRAVLRRHLGDPNLDAEGVRELRRVDQRNRRSPGRRADDYRGVRRGDPRLGHHRADPGRSDGIAQSRRGGGAPQLVIPASVVSGAPARSGRSKEQTRPPGSGASY